MTLVTAFCNVETDLPYLVGHDYELLGGRLEEAIRREWDRGVYPQEAYLGRDGTLTLYYRDELGGDARTFIQTGIR